MNFLGLHITETAVTPPRPRPCGFMRLTRPLASVRTHNSACLGLGGPPPLHHLDPGIIKMPEAKGAPRRGCFSSPTSHSGRERSDRSEKAQIRCFLHKHLFFFPPIFPPCIRPLVPSKSALETKPNKETNTSRPSLPPNLNLLLSSPEQPLPGCLLPCR